jgi:hypothetical protein
MPRPTPAVLRASALALSGALLVACGGGGGDGQSEASGGPLDELVQAGAAASADSGTSRISVATETTVAGQAVAFVGDGSYDHAAREGALTFSIPGADGQPTSDETIEERLIGDDVYLALPEPPGVFYRLALADVATTSLGTSAEPTAALQALDGLDDVEEEGAAEVRGVPTTRYRGELDVEQAVAGATGTAQQVLAATLGVTEAERVPFDAHLDDEGRLVRLVLELELPASPATGGREVTSRSTLELYDFGTEVDVEVPPAASVLDGAPLLAALRGATGGSPAPTPAPTTGSATPTPPSG